MVCVVAKPQHPPPRPATACMPHHRFDFHPARAIDVSFDAPALSSDAGVLLLRAMDGQLGLCARVAGLLRDERRPERVIHSRLEQVRQRVYQIALGYEDQNDAARLRHDPLLRTACDRLLDDERGLSSQPTLSRMEHAASAREVVRCQRTVESMYVESLALDTTLVVLDIDSTSDPTHGQQPLSFFHGHYDCSMYFPLLVFDGEGRLVSVRLRPGNAGNNRYAHPMMVRLVRAIKKRCAQAQVLVRGDSGFCSPRMLTSLEQLKQELGDVEYVFGFQRNPKIQLEIAPFLENVRLRSHATKTPCSAFSCFEYRALSWRRPRHVVAKAECLVGKENPRFLVTSLTDLPPRLVYERVYCKRGEAENRIKDFKRALKGDRLSCTTYVANAFRLVLHAVAYLLLDALREQVTELEPSKPRPQFDTLRLALLKVGAHVTQSVRRIHVALPKNFPQAPLFATLAARIQAPRLPPDVKPAFAA
jgi:hypothetical protein